MNRKIEFYYVRMLEDFQKEGEIEITEIVPHVYHLEFTSRYNLAMHFIRFQEYYESPKYHKRFFSLVDYMEWYSAKYDGNFSYPTDWSGFNVPSRSLLPFISTPSPIPDPNKYDKYMCNLIKAINEKEKGNPFYFIGTRKGDTSTLRHELSHAWYTVDPEYREKADKLLEQMDQEKRKKAREVLEATEYHPTVIDDEIVAYCSTGLHRLANVLEDSDAQPFVDTYNKFFSRAEKFLGDL